MSEPGGALPARARQTAELVRRDGWGPVAARLVRRAADRLDPRGAALPVRPEDAMAVDPAARPPHHRPAPRPAGAPVQVSWVMSPPAEGSGGHTTALRMVQALEETGHRCRIFLYDRHAGDLARHEDVLRRCWPAVQAEVGDAFAGLPDAQVTFATSWPTAYLVHRDPSLGRRLYLVQDLEPSFYPAGSEAALAEATYRFGFHGLTAGPWLAEALAERYEMTADWFPFGCDLGTYRFRDGPRDGVALFARTTTPRRAFELAVLALACFHDDHPDVPIHLFGERPGRLPFPVRDHGVLAPPALAELYNRCWAGLVLSMSNVSLVPLEMLAAGCVPVLNDAEHNRAVLGDVPACYARPEPRALAAALGQVVTAGDRARARRAAASVAASTWDPAARSVVDLVTRVAGAPEAVIHS